MWQPEHTPGPWALGHSTLHGSNGEPIMMARTFLMLTPADRSLIIAAPDLLAACEAAMGFLESMVQEGTVNWSLAQQLKAAIAKTRGEAKDG